MKPLHLTFIVCVLISHGAFANDKFSIEGDVLHYDTSQTADEDEQEITAEDVDYFAELLNENAAIKSVYLTSWGGDVESSYAIADLVIDYELDTHAVDICFSGCTTIFIGGTKRTLAKGSKIGFHRGWWSSESIQEYYESEKESAQWDNPFEFASWVYEDAQEELYKDFKYMLERDIEPFFAIESIKAHPDDEGWYPRRKALLKANVLTE